MTHEEEVVTHLRRNSLTALAVFLLCGSPAPAGSAQDLAAQNRTAVRAQIEAMYEAWGRARATREGNDREDLASRLLRPSELGNVPPVEYEMNYYRSREGAPEMVGLN